MIRIIQGTYGKRENGTIIPMTSESGTFELTAEKEKKLVDRGVAEYVAITETVNNEYNEKMTLDELKNIANKNYNIDTSKLTSKKKVIEAIEAEKQKNSNNENQTLLPPGTDE